jgi:hypothetical protein
MLSGEDGLKGHKKPAQGSALGYHLMANVRPGRGKSINPDEDDQFFCPYGAHIGENKKPRALPWAGCCWPSRPNFYRSNLFALLAERSNLFALLAKNS